MEDIRKSLKDLLKIKFNSVQRTTELLKKEQRICIARIIWLNFRLEKQTNMAEKKAFIKEINVCKKFINEFENAIPCEK